MAQCVDLYLENGLQFSHFHRCILRSIIGVKALYGDKAKVDGRRTDDVPNTKADRTVLALYDSLTLEQCLELYKVQHDNLNRKTRFALRAIIGAKVIYGENYGKPPLKKL
jgi:hypothetical protein